MKLRKLYIEAAPIAEPNISGIGHMTLEIIRSLERHPDCNKTFKVVLVVAFNKKHMLERWGFTKAKVKTIPIHMRLFNILWKFDLLPPMDLILGKGTYIFPNYKNWKLARSANFTFVCDVSYLVVPQFVSPKNQQFLEKNIHKWVKRSDRVLCISKNAQKEIVEHLHVSPERTILVPCGVDKEVFKQPKNADIDTFLNEYQLPKNYILYLGNLEPRKNVEGLVDAYKQLSLTLRNKHSLVLVGGGGWLNEQIIKKIEIAKSEGYAIVRPSKYVPDEVLPHLYGGAKILVHPAFYEGFGISPLQAMACGVPVVVADNSSLPEVVGDAALMINASDIADISDKMSKLLSDTKLQKSLIEKGNIQSNKYSWDHSAQVIISELGVS